MSISMRYIANLALGLGLFHVAKGAQIVNPAAEDCDLPFADSWTSGHSSGYHWCASQIKQGHFISGIRVYNSGDRRQHYDGIDIIYDNGDWTSIGKTQEGDNVYKREMYWDPTKTSLKRVDMQPNTLAYDEVHYGLRVQLTDGQEIYGGSSGPNNRPQNIDWDKHGKTPVYGNLIGISGMNGDKGVEQITFHTLNAKTKASTIHDVTFTPTFDELNARPNNEVKGLRQEVVSSGYLLNDRSTKPITAHFKKAVSFHESTTWSVLSRNTLGTGGGVDLKFDVGFNFLVFVKLGPDVTTKWEWKYEHVWETQTLTQKDNTTTDEYWVDAEIDPGKAVHVWGYSVHGDLDVGWKGTLTVTFDNDKSVDLPISGQLKGVRYSQAWFHVEDAPVDKARAAVRAGEAMYDLDGKTVAPELVEDALGPDPVDGALLKGRSTNAFCRIFPRGCL